MKLKLGTRRSLLAWAQSSWVAREVEKTNPGVKVDLVGIETQGDRIQDMPLSRIEGKEFFVKEIDEALLSKKVDFTVHSMKDLSLDRPTGIYLAAIPARENPRDVIIFGSNTVEKLKTGEKIFIGSSSPRRLENIPQFLKQALPKNNSTVEFKEIRGNVNTRLSRLHESRSSEKYLDGVVLAFAGLIRLFKDESGNRELRQLFKNTRWMVLPLKECPAAPAQGALAIECRIDDESTKTVLSKLHHFPTQNQVAKEREILKLWGGGCHQKFGATCVEHSELGELFWIRGKKPDETFVEELSWKTHSKEHRRFRGSSWDGSSFRETIKHQAIFSNNPPTAESAIFAAHARAIPESWLSSANAYRLWTSGTHSWFQLAKQGLWVEGCAEGLGFQYLEPTLSEPVLGLPLIENWVVVTHESALKDWKGLKAIPTYKIYETDTMQAMDLENLESATYVFWSSFSQFEKLRKHISEKTIHACGPGKTAVKLKALGISPLVFPSVQEWRKWIA